MNNNQPAPRVTARERGRPREFNLDAALDGAIDCFRTHGYHGVSISDLAQALGLSTGSLYKAFGSKHQLFRAALARYRASRSTALAQATSQGNNGREKLRALLRFYAASSSGAEGRQGCLVVASAVELASSDPVIAADVAAAMSQSEQGLSDLLREGIADGSVTHDVDVAATARTLLALMQGMRVLGKSAASGAMMDDVVERALRLVD